MDTGPDLPSSETHSQSSPITGSLAISFNNRGSTLAQSVTVFTRYIEHPPLPQDVFQPPCTF